MRFVFNGLYLQQQESQRYYVSGNRAYLRKQDWRLSIEEMKNWYKNHPGQWIRAYSAKEAIDQGKEEGK